MEEIVDFFRQLLNSEVFMPRWVCGQWSEFHGWMYIISDLIIFLAYMAIPVAMLIFVRKRWHDVPFKWVFWLFIAFISLCGTTHLIDAIIFYIPVYRLNALVLLFTAAVSMLTVAAMAYVLPKALAYKSPLQLERIVEDKTNQLQDRIEELNRLSERVGRKKEQLEHFAYITSHNLRAPAANLQALSKLFAETQDKERQVEISAKIEESSRVLIDTIDDVSHVVTHSSPQLPAAQLSFKTIIDDVLNHHQTELVNDEIHIKLSLDVEELHYPPDHFRNIIQNLIDNAFRYRSAERPLELSISTFRTEDEKVHFKCSDNGIGIDLEKGGDKLFKLYKTLHNHAASRGIGLFLVRNQLETLGGSITVESKPGSGAAFDVTFGDISHIESE